MKGKIFKIIVGLFLTVTSIIPTNMVTVFAAEKDPIIIDDTQNDGTHYFTFTGQVDPNGETGWANDTKSSIIGEEYAKTQHWVWNKNNAEASKHTYTFTFVGTGVELWGVKNDATNIFQLDGENPEELTITGAANTPVAIYTRKDLAFGEHKVSVTLPNDGTHTGLQVSYAKVFGVETSENIITSISPIKQDGSINKFQYTAIEEKEWVTSNSEAYIDLKTDGSNAEGCYYEIPFIGNGIEIFANKNKNHGKVRYTVDGTNEQVVDLYQASRSQPMSVYKLDNLSEGAHTLKAVLLTEKNPNSAAFVNQVAYANISHLPYVVTDITLEESSFTMTEGATQQIKYSITPDYAELNDAVYTSSDKNVAVVSKDGMITAQSKGKTTITLTSEEANITKSIDVTVKEATPQIGGSVVEPYTQYTQDRYAEVKELGTTSKQLTAWTNDTAISELSLYSKDSSLTNVTVTASDFQNGAHILKASNIKTTFIKSTLAYNGSYLGYGDKNRPLPEATESNRSESNDILYQSDPINVGYNKLQNVWVEINVPKGTPAGTYTGALTVSADGIQTPLTFDYTVVVQNAELADASDFKDGFDIELWQYPYSSAEYYGVEPFSEEHLNILKSNMDIYKKIGGHAITTTIVEDAWSAQTYSAKDVHYPSMVKWTKNEDGSFHYDYTDFDKWVEFNKSMGIGDKIVLYSIAPWHNSFTYWENGSLRYEAYSVGSERYNQLWRDFLGDMIDHLMEKGWFEESYIGIDERGFSATAFDLIDSVKNIHGESLKTAGAMDGFVDKPALALRVDDLNVGDTAAAAHPVEFQNLLKKRNELGYRTTLYSCTEHQPGNFSLSAPVESYWSIVNAGKDNTVGFLRWAYDAWVADPLNDATHNAFEPGDCFNIYPDEKDAQHPVSKSSVRLEMMADGVRDVNKLMMMEKEIPSLESEIDALYNKITITATTSRSYLSDAKVAQLSNEVTAFKQGLAELTNRYLMLKENGTDVVESLKITEGDQDLMIGSTLQLHSVITPKNLLNTNVTWTTSNEKIVSVTKNGQITGNKVGKAFITVTSQQDPSKSDTIEINVTAAQIEETAQVAYYSFDEMDNTTIKDAWGNRDGESAGAGLADGKSGKALSIVKEGTGVTLHGDSGLGTNDAWTISYWVNSSAEFNQQISELMDHGKDYAFSMKMADGRDSGFRVGKGSGDVLTFKYPFVQNTWYNITWTQSKSVGLTMYVNGKLVSQNNWTKTNTIKAPIDIIGGTGFTGLIDEVKVYNRILNESEIAAAMMVNGLNLTETSKTMYINDTYKIETNLISNKDDKTITYTSSDPDIASITSDGIVTAKARGEAFITVENKAAGYKETVSITVKKKLNIANKLNQYQLSENNLSVIDKDEGGERQYLGQPDMVRLSDGTLLTSYPVGHGKGPLVLKSSTDDGETWSEHTDIPKSWANSQETPTMYVLNLTDGTERVMLITACPGWGDGSTGWNTSYSDDGGKTWTEYEHWYTNLADGTPNKSIVGMASLIQLKDENGNDIQKWMGVYHNYDYVNYKTYLTFDEDGNEQWSEPEPYLSEYRDIESSYMMCEIGMFRSPDGKRIVGLARSQSHNNPATLIYSDDEGETWSEPMDLPGSLAGERHKAAYDPISGRLLITFRELNYDANGNNEFDGNSDWTAGDWVAWVGTYEDLMEQNEGQYRILIAEDWANNAKSGDTGYAGLVVLEDGTFIMDSYGHWDKDFSMSWPSGVTTDLCYIKQAKFKLSEIDYMAGLIDRSALQETIAVANEIKEQGSYSDASWDAFKEALANAVAVNADITSSQKKIKQAEDDLTAAMKGLIKTVVINVESNDLSMGTVNEVGRVELGSMVTIKAVPKEGYHFIGWRIDGKTVSLDDSYTFEADSDITIRAVFEENQEEPKPDEYTSNLVNDNGEVIAEGIFEQDTKLHADQFTNDELKELISNISNKALLENIHFEKVFNIYITKNDRVIDLDQNVVIGITLTNEQLNKKLDVIYIDEAGNVKLMESYIKDGKIYFTTDHFSTYAIISYPAKDQNDKNDQPDDKDGDYSTSDTDKVSNKPETGDSTDVNALIFITLLSGACIALLAKKKSNFKR